MNSSAHPTFKVFETRESEEYMDILSTVLSVENSSSPIYQDLVSSSFKLSPDASDKIEQSHNLKIDRVINIDYVGMTAAVLLDRELRHTRNAHYGRLDDLLKSLGSLNERGVAVKIRIVLQYPYSLAGQNRILSEMWDDRAYMGEAHGRNETELAPALTMSMIEHSALIRAQQYCLENLKSLRDRFEVNEPNKLEIRFAFISTLICGLRVNNLFFYDPYHYGRVRGTNTCAYTSNPVVMIDGSDRSSAYQAFCNHFRVIWECDSTLGFDDVIETQKGMGAVIIKRPEKLDPANKAKRLRELGSFDDDWEKKRKGQLNRLVNRLCPIIRPVDEPEWGFLAAAWEEKRDGNHGLCIPALILAEMFGDAFPSLDRGVRVSVLQTDIGESLSRSLFGMLDGATFSIIVLTKEIEGKYCKPNVYFEMGYLLNRNRTRRTLIVAEEGMHFPSDLSDVISTHIRRSNPQSIDEMKRVCKKLLEAMERAGIINGNTLKELLKDWLPRWQPSDNLLREMANYFEK